MLMKKEMKMALPKPATATNTAQTEAPATQAAQTGAPFEEEVKEGDVIVEPAATKEVRQPTAEAAAVTEAGQAGGGAMVTGQAGGALAASTGQRALIENLESQGLEGLQFGFGSFPQIILANEGTFESQDGHKLGKEFTCRVQGSKPKWIYKNGGSSKTKDEEMVFSYDQVNTTAGGLVADVMKEWKEKYPNYTQEVKKYLDVSVEVVDAPSLAGEIVLLSIPPTSVARFSGKVAVMQGRNRGVPVSNLLMRVYVGDKVTKTEYPFYPWAFDEVKQAAK